MSNMDNDDDNDDGDYDEDDADVDSQEDGKRKIISMIFYGNSC